MKFSIDSKIITEVYGKISKLLNAKSPVPILSGTLVQANENCILFTASDGTEGVIHRVPVKDNEVTVEEEGSTVLPKEAFEVSRKLKGNVKFHLVDQTIKIQTDDKTNLEFSVMDANEFPAVNKIKNTNNPIKLKPDEFRTIIKKVAFAVSDSDVRPILQGINFNISQNQATFYATDSHRLSRYIAHVEGSSDINVTVPAKFLDTILKSLDENHDVMVFIDNQDISIVNGNTIYCSRLLEGNYPNVSSLIPSPNFHLVVHRQEFIDALEMLLIISKTRENGSIKLSVNGLFVNLEAMGEIAKGNKEIAFELYDGNESFEIAFNGKFMIDALKAINNDSVKLGFIEAMRPIVIMPNEEQAQKEIQLVLPIRIS